MEAIIRNIPLKRKNLHLDHDLNESESEDYGSSHDSHHSHHNSHHSHHSHHSYLQQSEEKKEEENGHSHGHGHGHGDLNKEDK